MRRAVGDAQFGMLVLLTSLFVTASTLIVTVGLGRLMGNRAQRRQNAQWAANLRASCNSTPPADPSKIVELVLEHSVSRRAWHMPGIGWIDADDLVLIAEPVIGWRDLRRAPDRDLGPLQGLSEELMRRGEAPL